MFTIRQPFLNEIARNTAHCKSEEIFHLRGKDNNSDTGGETHNKRVWDKFDHIAQPGQSHNNQQYAGNKGSDDQTTDSKLLDNGINDDNKSARWPTDLHTATAQGRYGEAGDDSSKNAL